MHLIKKQLSLSTKPELEKKKKKGKENYKAVLELTRRQTRENVQVDVLVCIFSQERLEE